MFELGTELKGCVLFHEGGKTLSSYPGISERLINQYLRNIPVETNIKSLWFDVVEKKVFSQYQFTTPRNAGKEQNFFVPSEGQRAKEVLEILIAQIFENDFFSRQEMKMLDGVECLVSSPQKYEKFKDKRVMVVAGGPSSSDVSWDKVDYDHLWTVNEFYKNEKLRNTPIDLLFLGSIVQFNNKHLLEKIENSDVLVSLPLITNFLYEGISDPDKGIHQVENITKLFPEQCTHSYTRYSSSIGIGYKLVMLAIFAGAKEIYMVGNDGFSTKSTKHSFDGEKKNPNWYLNYGNRFQDRQLVVFWEYIMSLKKTYNFKIYNLGEGKNYNVSSDITEKICPLPQHIRQKIND